MWTCESERIGFQKCSSTAYLLRELSGLMRLLLVLSILFAVAVFVMRLIGDGFSLHVFTALLWPLAPLGAIFLLEGLIGKILSKKKYAYDYKAQTTTWDESGEQKTYVYVPIPRPKSFTP